MALIDIKLLAAVLLVAFVVQSLVRRVYVARYKPGVSSVPGPALAKYTSLWSFYHMYNNTLTDVMLDLHKKHGYYVRVAPDRVSITDPALVGTIYSGKAGFLKSKRTHVLNPVINGKVQSALIGARAKAMHDAIKGPIASAYTMSTVLTYEPIVLDVLRLFLSKLDQNYISQGKSGSIDSWIQLFSYDVITELTMGWRMGFLETGGDVDGALKDRVEMDRHFGLAVHMPFLDWLKYKNPIVRRFLQPTRTLMATANKIVERRLRSDSKLSANGRKDFVARALEAQEAAQLPNFRIQHYVGMNLGAGSEATAIPLRAIIYHALRSKDQHVVKRVQAELDDAGLSFPVHYKEAAALPYLDAVIKEGLRMFYVGSPAIGREVPPTGLELPNGITLPPGTDVGIAGALMHMSEEAYGPDAAEFRPERWFQAADEDDAAFKDRMSFMKTCDFSFGKGDRGCLGKNIALLELYTTLSAIFGLLDLELVDPKKDWTIQEGRMRIQSGIDVWMNWRPGKSAADLYSEKADAVPADYAPAATTV